MSEIAKQQSRLKDLIARGKEQGYLTYAEVNDHLPEGMSDEEQIENIIHMINDMGIRVFETVPDPEALLMADGEAAIDEEAAAEAAAALVAVESEVGRTTDPVRMYMREMGTVELLTREGEIVIAKRIEEGIREMMAALSFVPGSVEALLGEYALVATEERKLSDIISGYLDPMETMPVAPGAANNNDEELPEPAAKGVKANGKDDEEDDEGGDDDAEVDTGPDPEEAKIRFGELKKQFDKTQKALSKHGRDSKQAGKEMDALAEVFKFFKLTPRQFDPILKNSRDVLTQIRAEERAIMMLCVRLG
jgi:RNA polymerase primary sigma factor